jgi:RCC1-like G exchanging factor-like protein
MVSDKGQVWVWGFGLLGLGPKVTQAAEPLLIPENLLNQSRLEWNKSKITSIVAGLNHLAAVSSEGDLYTWGRNKDGVLGHGNTRDQPFPLRVII